MVFVLNQSRNSPARFDVRCAEKLSVAVRRKNKVFRKIYVDRWAAWFRKLRVNAGVDKERIARVLDWYCNNIGRQYVPQAFSGEAFYQKFEALSAAMERDRETTPKPKGPPAGRPTPEAARLAAELSRTLGWPKNSAKDLPEVVRASLENVTALLKRLNGAWPKVNGYAGRYSDQVTLRVMLRAYLSFFSGGKEDFVRRWFVSVNRRVCNWHEWSGSLHYFTWSPNHKDFDTGSVYAGVPDRLVRRFNEFIGADNEKPDAGD